MITSTATNASTTATHTVVRASLATLLCCTLTACATNGPPPIGSGNWHEQRMAEIQQAFDHGEIDKAQYLQLKSETDQIHISYRKRVRPQYNPRGSIFGGSALHIRHHP